MKPPPPLLKLCHPYLSLRPRPGTEDRDSNGNDIDSPLSTYYPQTPLHPRFHSTLGWNYRPRMTDTDSSPRP